MPKHLSVNDIGVAVQGVGGGSPWTEFPLIVEATTTNPTQGNVVYSKARWQQVGAELRIRYDYEQDSAGTAGVGTYVAKLPGSIPTIDLPTTGALATVAAVDCGSFILWNDVTMVTGALRYWPSQSGFLLHFHDGGDLVAGSLHAMDQSILTYSIQATLPLA